MRRGQSIIEYGLLLATIAVLALLGANAFGKGLHDWLDTLAGHITTHGS